MNIKEILNKHKKWLFGESGGERANLRGANLCNADLRGADLCNADLCGANLRGADLCNADLCNADLCGANLRGANLRGANLCGANLCGADLCGAKNIDSITWSIYTAFYPLQCPEKGAYTAYKKAHGLIVELEIPADAMRSSATSRKCRASKARVISITDVDGNPGGDSVASDYDSDFVYRVGETVEVPNFDTNRWNECAPGIHHFITRGEAVQYE